MSVYHLLFANSVQLTYLNSVRYTYLKLDGSTKQESRMSSVNSNFRSISLCSFDKGMDLVDQFNNDPDIFIFLISTAAGGTGLNLTGIPS